MALRLTERQGTFYVRGTVKAEGQSRSVYKTTGVRVDEPGSRARAEEVRIRIESRVYKGLVHGEGAVVTWTEAAAEYCERRQARVKDRRIVGPDEVAAKVLEITDFFIRHGVADRPLKDLPQRVVQLYFQKRHIDTGHAIATARKDENFYKAVMNFAVRHYGLPTNYPRPDLPDYDPVNTPVNKWLYPEEIALFLELASPEFRPLVAVLWGTGRRANELTWMKRTMPDYEDRFGSGLNLTPGREHIFTGRTKNGKPKITYLPDWTVEVLREWLDSRDDDYEELFLTNRGVPYRVPRRKQGGIWKTAWRALRERVAKRIEDTSQPFAIDFGEGPVALNEDERRERAAYIRKSTPHWARHNAASHLQMNPEISEAQMDSFMGWSDPTMKRRYSHLSPDTGKRIANRLDFGKRSA